jgi:hypothetical protein
MTQAPGQFRLNATQVRRQQKALRMALAYYLPGGALLTFMASLAASHHGGPPVSGPAAGLIASGLIALSAAQVDFYAVVIAAQILMAGRDLRRAGSTAGQLTLSGDGLSDGRKLIAWPQVRRVRMRRDGIAHVAVYWQARPGLVGRRKSMWLPSRYGVSPDAMTAAFERYAAVEDPGRPRAPVYDDLEGTVTFFANLGDLQIRRRRYLRGCWRIPLMIAPAGAGLFVAGQPLAAGLVLAVTASLLLRQYGKLAELARPLRLGKNGYGRMRLSRECLTLAGTDVAISWSHLHDATLSYSGRTGLDGVIKCPEPEPDESCRYRGRTIKLHIADTLFSTTVDELGAAFSRYIDVAADVQPGG